MSGGPSSRAPELPAEKSSGEFAGRSGHRLIVVSLAVLAMVLAWGDLTVISRSDPWYRNTAMNSHNMVDALSINSDVAPNGIDQPGLPLKYLLALDYRVRHYAGIQPVWNLKKFSYSPDPLREMPALIHVGRMHSRAMVFLVILAAAWLAYSVTRSLEACGLTVVLLCGCSGLLFHGLLTRPELLCVGFGNVLALTCSWRATATSSQLRHHIWLFLAGLFVGLAALTKLPGICYLIPCYAWCWLAALTARSQTSDPDEGSYWRGLLSAAGGASVYVLLYQLSKYHAVLDPLAVGRLRLAALGVSVLPLLTLCTGRNRLWSFLIARSHELALLGAGALAAMSATYWALRAVMTGPTAADYCARGLHVLVNPNSVMPYILAQKPEIARELLRFFSDAPFLFLGATAVSIAVWFVRPVPLRLKAFIGLLLVTGLGMALLMSKRYFTAQYGIFPQVPLLLAWALCLFAFFSVLRPKEPQPNGVHWAFPVILTAIFVLTLGVYFRLEPKYTSYQNDAALPVNELTLTFLFDHDVHSQRYLEIMKRHYGSREAFAQALDRYLADPAHRY